MFSVKILHILMFSVSVKSNNSAFFEGMLQTEVELYRTYGKSLKLFFNMV